MGIGGSGVSGLALMALDKGHQVSGCDTNISSYFEMAQKKGCTCYVGHDAKHIADADILVHTSAVAQDNIEMAAARALGKKVMSRGMFLAEMLKNDFMIGVGGSHGKTTTTWMIYHILREILSENGVNPSAYAGGKADGISCVTAGEPWVAELDESDGSIFYSDPSVLVITNLELEHVDYYDSEDRMLKDFETFLFQKQPAYLIIGRGYALSDVLYDIFKGISFPTRDEIAHKKTFYNNNGMDFVFDENTLLLMWDKKEFYIGNDAIPDYILQNRSAAMLAALCYCKSAGIAPKVPSKDIWSRIPGVERRFELKGTYKGVDLIDDYGHHPSELRVVADRARQKYGSFCVVFQPHRTSRFDRFYDQFRDILSTIEPLIILPVYSAGEKIDGKTSEMLFNELKDMGREVYYFDSVEKAGLYLKENIEKFRVKAVACIGAGDLNKIFDYMVKDEA